MQIIDDSGAITIYEISDNITVAEDFEVIKNNTLQIVDFLTENETFEKFRALPIPDISQKITICLSLFDEKNFTEIHQMKLEQLKKKLIKALTNLNSNDISDIKSITLVFKYITQYTAFVPYSNELINRLIDLTNSLYNYSESYDLNFLKQASDSMVESIGNLVENCQDEKCLLLFNLVQKLLNDLLKIVNKHLRISQKIEILTFNLHYKILRLNSKELENKSIYLSNGEFKLSNKQLKHETTTLQSFSFPRILLGSNGKEKNLENSSMISLSYYSDTSEKIKIDNQSFRIKIKQKFQNEPEFIQYNESNFTDPTIKAIIYKINLLDSNSSINFQIKPENKSQSFLVLIKFNKNPSLLYRSYDMIFPLCPEMLKENKFYQIFINSSTVNSFLINGHVGFSISPINDAEHLNNYCEKKNIIFPDLLKINLFNLNNFSIRIYSVGCYYLEKNGEWSSNGMDAIIDTNFEFTSCFSSHLTVFAGGFLVLPNQIDFESVFANSSFEKNSTVYITVIVFSVLYIFAAIICIYIDRKTNNELSVNYIGKNSFDSGYFYEVLIFTGSRKNSGTDSKVFINIYGQNGETQIKKLECKNPARKAFNRGGIDCFILGVENNLGTLELCKIYQDNSGKSEASSSWYLKYAVITDLQTNEKYYFICEKWLDVSTGQIEQNIPVSTDEKLKNFGYLLKRQTKDKLSDEHLWFSLISKPRLSNFSRIDRLTCCYVLLFTTMLTNILYYDVEKSKKLGGIEIGPFSLTAEQV